MRGSTKKPASHSSLDQHTEKPQAQSHLLVSTPLVLQRIYQDPASLTAIDIKHLQRTIGNRAVIGLLSKSEERKTSNAPFVYATRHEAGRSAGEQANQSDSISAVQTNPVAHQKKGFVAQRKEDVVSQVHFVGKRQSDLPIQREGFSQYLKSNRLPAVITPSDQEEIINAWILDQNIHDLVELLSGSMDEPVLREMASLSKYGLTTDNVVTYLRGKGAPDEDANTTDQMNFLNAYMQNAPTTLTNLISGSIQAKKGKNASLIKWHGLTSWGAGTGMTLLMRPGGLVKGFGPKGSPVWMKQLEQHVPPGGATTIYVQGHLLNHNIGGPGLDYNMVPLTGKQSPKTGGNDANGKHENLIESDAKKTWLEVAKGNYQEAEYQVIPDYSRATRAGTTQIRSTADKFAQIRLAWIQDRASFVAKQSATDIENVYKQTLKSFGIPIPNPLPPQQQMIHDLANKMASDDLDKPFSTLKATNHPLAVEIAKHIDAGILDASTMNVVDSYTIKDLLYLVTENAKVWEAEDKYVPAQLGVGLRWKDNTGTVHQHPVNTIPVILPSSPSAVGFRPKKKAEDA